MSILTTLGTLIVRFLMKLREYALNAMTGFIYIASDSALKFSLNVTAIILRLADALLVLWVSSWPTGFVKLSQLP